MGNRDPKELDNLVFKIPKEVYQYSVSPIDAMLFARILFFTLRGECKGCIESKSRLAAVLFTTPKTIQRSCRKLEGQGLLTTDKYKGLTRRKVPSTKIVEHNWKPSFFVFDNTPKKNERIREGDRYAKYG